MFAPLATATYFLCFAISRPITSIVMNPMKAVVIQSFELVRSGTHK